MQILTEVEEMIGGIANDQDLEIVNDLDPEIANAQDPEIANVQDLEIVNVQDLVLEMVENAQDQDLGNPPEKDIKKIMIPKKVPPRIGILPLDQNPALVKVVKSKVIAK